MKRRADRRGLAKIGLDRDLPPYPPAKREDNRPLRVEVITAEGGKDSDIGALRIANLFSARARG